MCAVASHRAKFYGHSIKNGLWMSEKRDLGVQPDTYWLYISAAQGLYEQMINKK